MRQILIERARARNAQKREGGLPKLSLEDGLVASADGSSEFESPGRRALFHARTAAGLCHRPIVCMLN